MDTVTLEWILARRNVQYRRTPALALKDESEARTFVDAVGFCFLWPIKDVELPNLLHAIAGRARTVPEEHADPDGSRCWGWKDRSLGQRWWYYGKLLRRRATMISLDLLPYFYACSANYGDLNDYLQEYQDGVLTLEARQVYEALLENGPLDTVQLRKKAHLSAESAKTRFDRALNELQVGLKVLPIGVAAVGAWRYAFVYEIVQRHFPDLPERARQIKRGAARRTLVQRYLEAVVAIEPSAVGQVFHVFNWSKTELAHTIAALVDEGAICRVKVEGETHWQLIPTRFIEA
ncbi:MAG: winged helix DNA-binding domain-containing protein [Anaerolineae bacterium]|nr:winged helix DNA-binding domain-containing protein [Anaerolineae bacterium]